MLPLMIEMAAPGRIYLNIIASGIPATLLVRATISINCIRLSMARPKKPSRSFRTNQGYEDLSDIFRRYLYHSCHFSSREVIFMNAFDMIYICLRNHTNTKDGLNGLRQDYRLVTIPFI